MSESSFTFEYQSPGEQRLDKFLVEKLSDFSRSRLQALIREGQVSINGKPAARPGQLLEAPATVVIHIPAPQPSTLAPEEIPLEIVFENEALLVINKPAGMVVHPAAGHSSGTLVNAALAYAPEMEGIGGEQRPGIVHRLDKDTSGLILLAKNDAAHRWLVDQFHERKVDKAYLVLVDGRPPTPTGRVEAPVGRSPANRQMMAVVPAAKGRYAVTEYRTLESFPEHTLLEAHPFTGRTHQIRVHMKFLGCPVAGDRIYGRHKPSLDLERQFLHAARLTIRLPGEEAPRTFEAPLPEDLSGALRRLRENTKSKSDRGLYEKH